jgi:hypothetical protein
MSSKNRMPIENSLLELDGIVLANPQHTFSRFSGHFAGIVRSHVSGENCGS